MAGMRVFFAYAASLAVLLATSFYATWLWLACQNVPSNNTDWILSKDALPSIMDITPCMEGPQIFAGDQLNLDAWHGFQEILYHRPVTLSKVKFRFKTDEFGYVVFIGYNKHGYFNAFRFSGNESYRSSWMSGYRTGRFKERITGNPVIFIPYTWHDAELSFTNGKMTIYVDGLGVTELGTALTDLAQVGFRSGLGEAMVDDVEIHLADGEIIREDFSNKHDFAKTLLIISSALLCLSLVFVAIARLRKATWQAAGDALFLCGAFVFLLLVSFYHYYTLHFAHLQPGEPLALQAKAIEDPDSLLSAKKAEFSQAYDLNKADNEVRILFLGTSQTLGEGAWKKEEGMVELTASYLPKLLPQIDTLVMNGASPGANAGMLLDAYKETYRQYQPDIMVLNLGIHDQMRNSFGAELEEFLSMNREDGVETIFMLEAYSPESPAPPPQSYAVMREIAEKHGIILVDAKRCLGTKRDTGFLFWDSLHPTSYGHDQISQCLIPGLINKVKSVSAKHAPSVRAN